MKSKRLILLSQTHHVFYGFGYMIWTVTCPTSNFLHIVAPARLRKIWQTQYIVVQMQRCDKA